MSVVTETFVAGFQHILPIPIPSNQTAYIKSRFTGEVGRLILGVSLKLVNL